MGAVFNQSLTTNASFSCALFSSFAVNICQNEQDITMHINPRFNAHGDENKIVCNSYQGGNWCEEVREDGFPFLQGEEFKVCICMCLQDAVCPAMLHLFEIYLSVFVLIMLSICL